ncbi:hypothetical protein H7Y29_03165 [Microbacteriaceae bacterium]|nr:hypothetical protein [Candidatus Saccharibacteria bacterium]
MNDDQFMKLFKYIQDFRSEVNQKLDEKASAEDMKQILDTLDTMIKKQEISDDERLVMGHQLERLDRWVHEVAKKIDYTLSA